MKKSYHGEKNRKNSGISSQNNIHLAGDNKWS